jgi:hypothetical protein
MKAKQERHAFTLRDLAMMIVAAHGPSYRDDHLVIEYRARRVAAPHGLDIWQRDDRTTKTLCMVWSDDDAVVVSYRSGPWEKALHRAAAQAADLIGV